MSLKDQSTLRVVLYEGEGAQPLETADRFAALTALLEKGFTVTRTTAGGRVAPADRSALLVLGRPTRGLETVVPRHRDIVSDADLEGSSAVLKLEAIGVKIPLGRIYERTAVAGGEATRLKSLVLRPCASFIILPQDSN